MLKRTTLTMAIAAILAVPTIAQAEIEVTTHLKNETAFFTNNGQTHGSKRTVLDDRETKGGDTMKFENSARIFINGEFGEESSWHSELNFVYDTEGYKDSYKGHDSYTQQDFFRELYFDTNITEDISLRFGKQQVVWGTADGIKLLDIINPTDYRELVQNSPEESRIPIWMANVEMDIGESSNFQFIVSEVQENVIPGLNEDGAQGHPFQAKGVETITGEVNGFLNIAPALGLVASSFVNQTLGGAFGVGARLGQFGGLTVHGFAGGNGLSGNGLADLNGIAQGTNNNVTNLLPVTGTAATDVTWNPSNPGSAFEYMPTATFATFNTFGGISSSYTKEKQDDDANLGFRFKSSLDNGLNYSLNYAYHYSANPSVGLSWHSRATGEELSVYRAAAGVGGVPDSTPAAGVTAAAVEAGLGAVAPTILLKDSLGNFYAQDDVFDDTTGANLGTIHTGVDLRFTERLHRVNSIGSSFDFAIDTDFAPLVLRAEFLYDEGDKQVVVNKALLAIGDLTNALTVQDADYFKYVIGLDATVLTNLLVSTQFIQFRNLDYVDESRTCTAAGTGAGSTAITYDCSTYTGEQATLSLTNGLQQAEENKEFVSLFLSKPFGEDQLGRWNNILIWEEGDGYWNRFDAEYSLTDQLIVSGEVNTYWGNENTGFGQFEDSSNVQFGVKYIFEN